MTKTNELKAYLARREMSMEELAKAIGISRLTLSRKMNNLREFKASEVVKIQFTLEMSNEERDFIFFN